MLMGEKLKKIENDQRVFSLFFKLRDRDIKCFIWRFIGDKKILAQIKVTQVRKYKKDFFITPYSEAEQSNFDLIIGTTEEVNFYIPNDLVVFRCKLVQLETDNKIILKIPPFFAQVERRKFLRLNVYENESASAKFSKCNMFPKVQLQYFQKKCFDVSAGGISIIISKLESKYFQMDDEIHNMEVIVGGYLFYVNAKVVASQEIVPGTTEDILYRVQRINLKFTKIQKKDFEFISQYVFERVDIEKDAV